MPDPGNHQLTEQPSPIDAVQGTWFSRLTEQLFAPVAAEPLVLFRIAYGATLLYWSRHYLATDVFEQFYVLPRFHFPYFGFEWVQALSPDGMRRVFIAIQILAVLTMLGVWYRLSSLLLGLTFCYVFLVDRAFYQNHYYLLSVVGLVLPWLPCHRIWSVDALLRPSRACRVVPRWSLYMIRFLVGIPYFFGGIAKINSDWLAGQPMRAVLAGRDWHPVVGPFCSEEWFVMAFVWTGLLFDLLIVPALMWKPTRLPAFVASIVFHLLNATLFQIGVFPWFMIAATLMYLPADSWRRLLTMRSGAVGEYRVPSVGGRQLTVGALTIFVVFHLVWPLRHNVMAGNVNWTEHGHYFSWRMKLRGKTSALRLEAFDPVSGAMDSVNPQRWLTSFQVNRMARDPRMIHDFARFLKQQFADERYPQTQVRALVLVSLNGRKPQLLIDPNVDLGSLPSVWTAPTFVLPLTEPLRFHAWNEPRTHWVRHLPPEYRTRQSPAAAQTTKPPERTNDPPLTADSNL